MNEENIDSHNQLDCKDDEQGDKLSYKDNDNTTLRFQNVDDEFISSDNSDNRSFKSKQMYDFIKNNKIDVWAMAEMNI